MGIGFDTVNVTYSFPPGQEPVGRGTLAGGEIPAGGHVERPLTSTFTAPWSVLGALQERKGLTGIVGRSSMDETSNPLSLLHTPPCVTTFFPPKFPPGPNFLRDMNRGRSDIIVRGNVRGYSTGGLDRWSKDTHWLGFDGLSTLVSTRLIIRV